MMEEPGSGFICHAGSGDPRRRGRCSARTKRRNPAGRRQPLHRDAQARPCATCSKARSPTSPAAGGRLRDQPLRPGCLPTITAATCRSVSPLLQAPGQLPNPLKTTQAPQEVHRPLRRDAAADPHAARNPPPAHAGQALRRGKDGCVRNPDQHPVRPARADRPGEGHHADPEGQDDQNVRPRQADPQGLDAGSQAAGGGGESPARSREGRPLAAFSKQSIFDCC